MNKISALFLLAFLLPAPTFSQSEGSVPYLTDSSRSIQFGIGMLTLRQFSDGTISFRQHLSSTNALRIGFQVYGYRYTDDQNTTVYHGDTLMDRQHTRETRVPNITFNIRALYQWYQPVENDLYLFAGLGPQAGYDENNYSDNHTESWSIGVTGNIGAEWFASRRISLHAEYSTDVQYFRSRSGEWDTYYNDLSEYSETTRDGLALSDMSVLFGLSVYF